MELRHLRYFVAIAEERSITRAAERLWIAQPGLSTQIRRLEAELGVRLFERHTRGVDRTDAGELFLERARATLAAAEDARSTGRDLAAGLVGAVRLGLPVEARRRSHSPCWPPSDASVPMSRSPCSSATAALCCATCATDGSTR
jgi:DNA-binding transcriptional LysR family regulator